MPLSPQNGHKRPHNAKRGRSHFRYGSILPWVHLCWVSANSSFANKGNYDTRYCDRVAEGETRSCQELAAQENYKKNAANRPALAVYDRYYRRYAARKKVRQIKEYEFKKWRYEAMRLRDDCEAGKIAVEEYTQWMEGYFPNRKKPEHKNAEK